MVRGRAGDPELFARVRCLIRGGGDAARILRPAGAVYASCSFKDSLDGVYLRGKEKMSQ